MAFICSSQVCVYEPIISFMDQITFLDAFISSERTFLINDIVTHKNSVSNQSSDPQILGKNRLKHPNNPLISYFNINSLKNRTIDAPEVIGKLSLDYFVISETKLDKSFPSAQFNISNYEIRNRRDIDKNGGGLIEFVTKGYKTKRLKDYETLTCEFIISKKKMHLL